MQVLTTIEHASHITELLPSFWHLRYAYIPLYSETLASHPPCETIELLADPSEKKDWEQALIHPHTVATLRKGACEWEIEYYFQDRDFVCLRLIFDLRSRHLSLFDQQEALDAALADRNHVKTLLPLHLYEYCLLFASLHGYPLAKGISARFRALTPAAQEEIADHFLKKYELGHVPASALLDTQRYADPLRQLYDMLPENRSREAMQNQTADLRSLFRMAQPTYTLSSQDTDLCHEATRRVGELLRDKYGKKTFLDRTECHYGSLSGLLPLLAVLPSLLLTIAKQGLKWISRNCRGRVVLYQGYFFEEIVLSLQGERQAGATILRSLYQLMLHPEINIYLYPAGADNEHIRAYKELFATLDRDYPESIFACIAHTSWDKTLEQTEKLLAEAARRSPHHLG